MGAHSSRGFSGQHIIMCCPGSVEMQSDISDEPNEQSIIGTLVHEIAEKAYLYGLDAKDFAGIKVNGKRITKAMAESAQTYVDYLHKIIEQRPNADVKIEAKVKMTSVDADNLWGTSDAVIIDLESRTLIIGDLKNGYGLVEPDPLFQIGRLGVSLRGNPQLMGYTIGTLDTFNLWDKIDHVVNFIAQPNVFNHKDGEIRHAVFTMAEVENWQNWYRVTHAASMQDKAPLYAGNHCRYCKARGVCAVRIEKLLNDISISDSLRRLEPSQLIAIYDGIPAIKKALEAVEEKVTELSRGGYKVPGKKLVRAIVRAECKDPDGFVQEAIEQGHKEEDLFNKKLKGKTDIKQIVGNDLAHKYFITPSAGFTLVGEHDKRPPAMSDRKPRFSKVK